MRCAVIGLGRFGKSLAQQLHDSGAEVVAVDRKPELVDEMRGSVSLAVRIDSTDEKELKAQGLHDVDVAVVAIGTDFEGAALTTALLKKLGVRRVIARSTSALRGRILRLIGADECVSPEEEAARETARRVLRPALADYLKLSAARSVVEVLVPPSFHGRTVRDLDLRKHYHVTVIGIKRKKPIGDPSDGYYEEELLDPGETQAALKHGDSLIVVGRDKDLGRLVREAEKGN